MIYYTSDFKIKWACSVAFKESGLSINRYTNEYKTVYEITAHTQEIIKFLDHALEDTQRLLCIVKDHHSVVPYELKDKPARLLWRVALEDHHFCFHYDQSSDTIRRSNQRVIHDELSAALDDCTCSQCDYELDYSSHHFIYYTPCGCLTETVIELEGALADHPFLQDDEILNCAQCEQLHLEEDYENPSFCSHGCEYQHKEDHSSECTSCGDDAIDPKLDRDHFYDYEDNLGKHINGRFLCYDCSEKGSDK